MTKEKPNPGSPEAVERGCTCPVIDNHHGRGYQGDTKRFACNNTCPLHGLETKGMALPKPLNLH